MKIILAGLGALGLACALFISAYAGGKLLGDNVQVTDGSLGTLGAAEAPGVAALGSTVYAVWKDTRDHQGQSVLPNFGIYLAKSSDGGVTWSPNSRVSDPAWDSTAIGDPTNAADPLVGVGPDGRIWVLWYVEHCFTGAASQFCGGQDRDNVLRIATSTDGGAHFQEFDALAGDPNLTDLEGPALSIDPANGTVYFAYHPADGNGYDVAVHFADLAHSQKGDVQVSGPPGLPAGNGRAHDFNGPLLSVAARNAKVCVAWEDTRSANAVYGACSSDGGKSYAADRAFSGANAAAPRVALAPNGDLYLAYQQAGNLFVRRSTNNGASWSQPVAVTQLGNNQAIYAYDLRVDDDGLVAVLYPVAQTVPTRNNALFLAASIDQGQSFATIQVNDQNNGVPSQRKPALATGGKGDGARAYMVWQDDRDPQQTQIWAAHAELDSTPPSAPSALKATAGDTSVALTWNPSSDRNGIQGYQVLRAAAAAALHARQPAAGRRYGLSRHWA